MLDSLRKAAGTWVAKLLLILLVVSFAIWGISGQMMSGAGGNAVVTAGGTSVSPVDYRLAYDRQIQVLSQQVGQRITREQATLFGVDQQVLAQLVAGAVLDEQARLIGLGVSQDKIAQLTAEDPAFRGQGGRFDRQQFDFVLRQVGMRPEDYFRNREQVAVRQQIVEAVSDGMKAPDAFLNAVSLYQGENRTIEYVTLQKSILGTVAPPAEDVLAKWFEENKAKYAAPEYRKIAYVKLEPADIADTSAITDEDVAKDYEANKARYTTPETRKIEQLVFADDATAQAAAESLKSGSTFDSLVVAQGKTMADVSLGTFRKSDVSDPAVGEAAFKLGPNEVSPVVAGAFGPVLIRVTEINPEVVKPLADVSSQIRQDLALVEARAQLLDVHDAYEDARAAGQTMEEAAAAAKLKVVTVDAVDRNALDPSGAVISTIPSSKDLLQGAFESQVDVENPPLTLGAEGFVFYEVKAVTPARDRTLDEVREKVVADWVAEETERLFSARAAELEKKLRDAGSLDAIATELGVEKQVKRGLRRGAEDAEFGPDASGAIFSVAQGGSSVFTPADGNTRVLFKVTEVFEPAGAGADAVDPEQRKAYATGMADDLLDQLVARLQSEYKVTSNQAAIQQALSF